MARVHVMGGYLNVEGLSGGYPDQGLPGDQPGIDNSLPGMQPGVDNSLPKPPPWACGRLPYRPIRLCQCRLAA